ncbi:hypothetical protein H9P43_007291 [Blastocladiella emersonii ATCC 22665]|nr:hypothetical protein H9P43_007291 [Blastocladiella emersonii ATCC 22665]
MNLDLVEDILLFATAATLRGCSPCKCVGRLSPDAEGSVFNYARQCPTGPPRRLGRDLRAYLHVAPGLKRLQEFIKPRFPRMQPFHVYADDRPDWLRVLRMKCGCLMKWGGGPHVCSAGEEPILIRAAYKYHQHRVLGEVLARTPTQLVDPLSAAVREARLYLHKACVDDFATQLQGLSQMRIDEESGMLYVPYVVCVICNPQWRAKPVF